MVAPEKGKQPLNVVFRRRAKVAFEQASDSDTKRKNSNRVTEAKLLSDFIAKLTEQDEPRRSRH